MRSATFLGRREASGAARWPLSLAAVAPTWVTARFIVASSHTLSPAAVPMVILVWAMLLVGVLALVRATLAKWRSRTTAVLIRLWSAYTAAIAVIALVTVTWTLVHAAGPAGALAQVATAPIPLADVAPAVLIGPLAWAFLLDAFHLGARGNRTKELVGHVVLVLVMLLPLGLYYFGLWWGLQEQLPHIWRWQRFRIVIASIAIGTSAAALWLLGQRVVESIQVRNLDAQLDREGIL